MFVYLGNSNLIKELIAQYLSPAHTTVHLG